MEKIIIFGTGRRLDWLIEYKCLRGGEIIAFCDNDEKKQGLYIDGVEIIAPSKIKDYEYDAIYISTIKFFDEIKLQLLNEIGVQEEKIRNCMIYEGKYHAEFNFWRRKFYEEGGKFTNSHYKNMMLELAEEVDDRYMEGKIVADFGCGPRGSLAWTNVPLVKLGIDILANRYWDNFGNELAKHNMVYITSSETKIPLPDAYVDYLYIINSLDHVYNLDLMMKELMRILKPGGIFLANFNLNELKTDTEPQTLTEKVIKEFVKKNIELLLYKIVYPDGKEVHVDFNRNQFFTSFEINNNVVCKLLLRGKKL